ncbi:MAG: NAD(P)H-hydrate dehydratase [Clostridiaceae bacterium]
MKIGSADVMRKIDSYTINELGIPGIVLMENASLKVLDFIEMHKQGKVCIICSKGNNGGDGFAIARHLFVKGRKVCVFLVGSDEGMTNDCRINYDAAGKIGIDIVNIRSESEIRHLKEALNQCVVAVDAIFGTGLNRKAEGIYGMAIEAVNCSQIPVISVDVPSGMNSDTGETYGCCITADLTVTFQLYKKGFFNYRARKFTGRVEVADIGIPETAIERFHEGEYFLDAPMVKGTLKARDEISHKGDFGRVLIIAGTRGYSGAAYISATSAVRCGSGLVTLACDEHVQAAMSSRFTEAMTCRFDDSEKLNELMDRCDVIAIGPGLGINDTTMKLLENVLRRAKCPVVIDADGLNLLAGNTELLKSANCQVVITPHPGEMSRLTGYSIEYIESNRAKTAKEFAMKHNITVLLKGYRTIITNNDELYINSTGNSAMASGGMGDCLTGMIASFIGQGYAIMDAVCIAAYIHGYTGEKLSKQMFCVNAVHVMENLPYSIHEVIHNPT